MLLICKIDALRETNNKMEETKEDLEEKVTFEEYREYQKNYYINKSLHVIKEQEKKDQEWEKAKWAVKLDESLEVNSGIALKPNRALSNEDLKQLTGQKKYVRIDALNKSVRIDSLSHWFTIGILCTASSQRTSKINNPYRAWSFSSLVKSCSEMANKQVYNGYRMLNVILFGRLGECDSGNPGDVYAIIDPSSMPKDSEYELALKVINKSQLIFIGKALHFKYCGYLNPLNGTPCRNFVNDSIENHCRLHNVQTNKRSNEKNNTQDRVSKSVISKRSYAEEPIVKRAVTPIKISNEEYKDWMTNEKVRFSKYLKQRKTTNVRSNQLEKILGQAELIRLDNKFVPKYHEIEIDTSSTQDNELIKKLFEKRKKNHSEKFKPGDTDVQQSVKRIHNS